MLRQDLAFARTTLDTKYIYALVPGGASWDKQLAAAVAQAEADSRKVRDFAGYQGVLRKFVGAFNDPHLSVRLNIEPASYNWPGFLVRHRAGHYVVVESTTAGLPEGSVVTSCDGRDVERVVADAAEELGYVRGIEWTQEFVARVAFVDFGNPLYRRPARCRIGEVDTELHWLPIPARRLGQLDDAHAPFKDPVTATTPFGVNGAWVHMATFAPSNTSEAKQFHDVIDHAAALRDKDVIVLDVRGNGGGSYNWFMAFLRELYGAAYADYYGRARLEIRPVMMSDPRHDMGDDGKSPFVTPSDTAMDALLTKVVPRPAAHGTQVYVMGPDKEPAAPGTPPPNLVHARVFVLTDSGCGSACISFVDEMRRFPGARHVGGETFVDRRSGTPLPYNLPSGNGALNVASMVREGRARGENIPWAPIDRFSGDMADTEALKKWIEGLAAQGSGS
jgi:hypothetical protein